MAQNHHSSAAEKAPMPPPSADYLRRKLETFPQKVYEKIYDMTFTAPPSVIRISVDTKMEFTNLAQVNSASRAKYLQSLCANTIFIGNHIDVLIWVPTIGWHRQLQDVRVFHYEEESQAPPDFQHRTVRTYGIYKAFDFETQMMESLPGNM